MRRPRKNLRRSEVLAAKANKHQKVIFEPGDLVWVNLRKDRFKIDVNPS
jgi:hypothetical protein